MNQTKFFNGSGFSPEAAIQNANDQADDFIAQRTNAGKQVTEISRDIQSTSQNGNYYYAVLKLVYNEK